MLHRPELRESGDVPCDESTPCSGMLVTFVTNLPPPEMYASVAEMAPQYGVPHVAVSNMIKRGTYH